LSNKTDIDLAQRFGLRHQTITVSITASEEELEK